MRQGAERQAVTHRAITGNEEYFTASRFPFFADPALAGGACIPRLNGKNIAGRCRQSPLEDAGNAVSLFRIFQFGIGRVDIVGKAAFLDDPFGRILIGRQHQLRLDAEVVGYAVQQFLRIFRPDACIGALFGDQRRVLPDRQAVLSPIEREGPAGQAFARIPFSLSVMQKAARCETLTQAADQGVGLFTLRRPDRAGVPLVGFEIVDGNKGRLAAHRQPDIMAIQNLVDLLAERIEFLPAFIRKRFGDARRFGNPADLHVEGEFRVGMAVIAAGNRCGIAIMWRCRQRNMAFAGQKT
ncbi:hypothetical protein D3C86_1239720 [compost metagenome]